MKVEEHDPSRERPPELAQARAGEEIEAANDEDPEWSPSDDFKILLGVGRDSSALDQIHPRISDGRNNGNLCTAIGVSAGLRRPRLFVEQGGGTAKAADGAEAVQGGHFKRAN